MPKYIDAEKFAEHISGNLSWNGERYNAANVISDLKTFPAADVEPKQNWIPVTERLPEEGVNVIAYEEQGFPYIDWICDGEWVIASNQYAEVTHWMPLPEPPKEEEDAKSVSE